MSSDDVILSVNGVSKCFEMYDKPIHRLYQTLCAGHKKFYKEYWALNNINFCVRRGECVGIVGRNGAGKSTLLQIITGTLQPTLGSVTVHGRVAALLELGSGFNMEFTGRENVYINASIFGLSKAETDARFQSILDFAEIGEFIDQPLKTYSSGMTLRLAFAVVAHVDADILIIDEALAVGDVFFQQKCMRFIRKFKEEHTILFVSHDTGSVVNLCDRAVLLDHGIVLNQGESSAVTDHYLSLLYSSQQNITGSEAPPSEVPAAEEVKEEEFFRDSRQDFINASNLRNDIEIMKFDPNAEHFGDGGAEIVSVTLQNEKGEPLAWCVGGEIVRLEIKCRANRDIFCPIVGYYVRDHLGQELFGENTCISTLQTSPISVDAGEYYSAVFEFRMPIMRNGDYSILVSAASGTQMRHVQHQWIYEAVVFKSQSDSCCCGLVGVPHKSITLKKLQA